MNRSKKEISYRKPRKANRWFKMSSENFTVSMIACYFLSAMIILSIFPSLDLSLFQLFQLLSLFIGLGFFIPIKVYRKILPISFYEYILFNLLAFSPIFVLLIFALNMSVRGEVYIESYPIIHTEVTSSKTVYTLKDNIYEDKKYLRSVYNNEDLEIRGSENLAIYFSEGLLGIRIIEKKRIY